MQDYNDFSYKPGRTIEELERERFEKQMNTTYTKRFRKMIALIKISQKIKESAKQTGLNKSSH